MPGCNWTFSVAFSLIDWLLGGEGKGALEPRDVTEIEELVLQNVAHIICRELGTAWEILSADFHFDGRKQRVKASRGSACDRAAHTDKGFREPSPRRPARVWADSGFPRHVICR